MLKTVAALYVDPNGPYYALEGVQCWGLPDRDAKGYEGPYPVIAHPPCGPWGAFAAVCTRQDPECGPRAVEQVRRLGGILEHPAGSKLWAHCGLPRPGEVDGFGGRTVCLDQVAYGHPCRKRTWLYCVGIVDFVPRQGGKPTHSIGNSKEKRLRYGLPDLDKRKRHLTPPLLARALVELLRLSEDPV